MVNKRVNHPGIHSRMQEPTQGSTHEPQHHKMPLLDEPGMLRVSPGTVCSQVLHDIKASPSPAKPWEQRLLRGLPAGVNQKAGNWMAVPVPPQPGNAGKAHGADAGCQRCQQCLGNGDACGMLQHNRACAARRTLRILQHIPNSRRTRASWGRIQPPHIHRLILAPSPTHPSCPYKHWRWIRWLFITGVAWPGPVPMAALQRGAGAAVPAVPAILFRPPLSDGCGAPAKRCRDQGGGGGGARRGRTKTQGQGQLKDTEDLGVPWDKGGM